MPRDLLENIESINSEYHPRDLLANIQQEKLEPNIPFGSQYSSPYVGIGKNLLYGIGNVATGMAQGVQGLRNLPYKLTNEINPELAQRLSKGAIGSRLFAPDTTDLSLFKPGTIGELTRTLASVIPGAMIPSGLGMTGKAANIAGGALGGAATAEENPFIGAAVGGAGTALTPYLMAGALKGGKYLTNALKKELSNIPKGFQVGKYAEARKNTIKNIENTLSEEGLQKIKDPVTKLYNKVFKGFEEHEIPSAYTNTGKKLSLHEVSTTPDLNNKSISFFELSPKQPGAYNSNISLAVNILHKNPTLSNLGNVRRLISDEIVQINKIVARQGGINTGQSNKLHYLTKAKDAIDRDIEAFGEIVNPKAIGAFKEANKRWAKDIVPYEKAQNILDAIPDDASPETFAKIFTKKFISEKSRNINKLPDPIVNAIKKLNKQNEDFEIAKSMRKKLLYGGGTLLGGGYGLNKIKNIISGY